MQLAQQDVKSVKTTYVIFVGLAPIYQEESAFLFHIRLMSAPAGPYSHAKLIIGSVQVAAYIVLMIALNVRWMWDAFYVDISII